MIVGMETFSHGAIVHLRKRSFSSAYSWLSSACWFPTAVLKNYYKFNIKRQDKCIILHFCKSEVQSLS